MKFLDVPQSGSIGGATHSRNRAGQYKRNRIAPCQPTGTGRRAVTRAAFGQASSAWGALTRTQQEAWVAYADSYPYTDRLGQSIKLTGHQMFVAINAQNANAGQLFREAPPTTNEQASYSGVELTAAAGTPALSLAANEDGEAGNILIALSPPQSSGRLSCKQFWQHSVASGADGPFNLLAGYVAEYGALVVGQRIFCKITPVNAQGVTGVPTVVSCQVAA